MSTGTWRRTRLKYVADCNRMVLPESTSRDFEFTYVDIGSVGQGTISLASAPITFADAPSRARRLAEPGDSIVSTVRTYLRAVATVPESDEPLVFSTGFAVLHPHADTSRRFLSYYLQGDQFVDRVVAHSTGVSYPAITANLLMALDVELPPIDEQRRIADFLDRETAHIDALIAKQEQFIGHLNERRVGVVADVSWGGLDQDARLSPSGVENTPWSPDHWRRLRNKNVFREVVDLSADGVGELLTVSHITGVTPRSMKNVNMFEAVTLEGYKHVVPGDLAINTMWAWMGALGTSRYEGLVSPAYGVYRPLPDVPYEPRYFDYLYRTPAYVVEMTRNSRGITSSRLRLYPESFLRLPVVVPPLAEQCEIVVELDKRTSRIDALIAKAQELITLAKERRAALITEAVTGRIDVSLGRAA